MRRTLTAAILVLCSILLPAEAEAHPSWGIAVDRQGQVYFSDLKTVWKIDAQGRLKVFRAGGDHHTHDLNIDEAGNLYGADNSYDPATQRFFSAIWKMTPAGSFSYLLPFTEDPPEGISIWRDRAGNTYHATNYPEGQLLLLKRSPSNQLTVLAGQPDAARRYRQGVPYSIGGMAFGADGALYFIHGASVSKLAPNGALSSLAPRIPLEHATDNRAAGGSATQLFGITVDAQGNVYVADFGNRRVLKMRPDGHSSTLLRSGEIWYPTGVALRGDELYVLEMGQTTAYVPLGARVRKLSPDGAVRVLGMVDANGAAATNLNGGDDHSSSVEASQSPEAPERKPPYALIA